MAFAVWFPGLGALTDDFLDVGSHEMSRKCGSTPLPVEVCGGCHGKGAPLRAMLGSARFQHQCMWACDAVTFRFVLCALGSSFSHMIRRLLVA